MKNTNNVPRSQMIKFLVFVPLFFAFSLGMNWVACQFLDNVKFETMLKPQQLCSMGIGSAMFGWFLFLRKHLKKSAC